MLCGRSGTRVGRGASPPWARQGPLQHRTRPSGPIPADLHQFVSYPMGSPRQGGAQPAMRLCIEVLGKAQAGILGASWSRGYTLPGSGIDPSHFIPNEGMHPVSADCSFLGRGTPYQARLGACHHRWHPGRVAEGKRLPCRRPVSSGRASRAPPNAPLSKGRLP